VGTEENARNLRGRGCKDRDKAGEQQMVLEMGDDARVDRILRVLVQETMKLRRNVKDAYRDP